MWGTLSLVTGGWVDGTTSQPTWCKATRDVRKLPETDHRCSRVGCIFWDTKNTWDHEGLIRILQIWFLVFGEECLLSLIFFWNIKYPILSRQKYEIQQEHTLKIPSAQQNPVVRSGKWLFYSNSLGSENLETHRYFGALSLLFEGFPLKKSRPLLAKKNAINPITIASLMPHYLQRNSTH